MLMAMEGSASLERGVLCGPVRILFHLHIYVSFIYVWTSPCHVIPRVQYASVTKGISSWLWVEIPENLEPPGSNSGAVHRHDSECVETGLQNGTISSKFLENGQLFACHGVHDLYIRVFHTVFIRFSYGLHTVFIRSSYGFHTCIRSSYGFHTVFIRFSYGFHTVFIRFSNAFHMAVSQNRSSRNDISFK